MKTYTLSTIRTTRATECQEEAEHLLKFNHYLGSINRSYYCMFGCLRALLNEKGIFAKTHQGLLSKFNELYVKTGLFEQKFGENIRHVFSLRQTSDYDLDADLNEEDAVFALESARAFLKATSSFLT